jgi:hypothetical protein
MDNGRDIYGLIKTIIYNETIYLRHWIGKVVDDQDPSNKGRVKATVPELGFLADSDAIWCFPRQGYALVPPAIGEWVEIYFIGGDARRPVYLAGVGEVNGNTPEQFSDPKKKVLFQDPGTSDYAEYDESASQLTMKFGKINMGAGSQSFVLGDTLATFLSNLYTWATTHTHVCASAGSPSGVAVPPLGSVPNIKSSTIKGE